MEVGERLNAIERELVNLRSLILQFIRPPEQLRVVELKGALRGVQVGEEEIEAAKSSLFKDACE